MTVPPPAPGPGAAGCAHDERVEGVCTRCGHCEHEVILNGHCYACGAVPESRWNRETLISAASLRRKPPRSNDD